MTIGNLGRHFPPLSTTAHGSASFSMSTWKGKTKRNQHMAGEYVFGSMERNRGYIDNQYEGCERGDSEYIYKDTWKVDGKAYTAQFTSANTKEYCSPTWSLTQKSIIVPHDRVRKYLIAIDRGRYKDAETGVQRWAKKVIQLPRPASSPVDYILSDGIVIHSFQGSARLNVSNRNKLDWLVVMTGIRIFANR